MHSKITLGHSQKLAKRRGKADFGTFPDLNHLLEGVEARIGPGWSEYLPGGCGSFTLGPRLIICTVTSLWGHPQKLAKRHEKPDSGTFSDLNHLLEGVERSELVLGGRDTSLEVVGGSHWVLGW